MNDATVFDLGELDRPPRAMPTKAGSNGKVGRLEGFRASSHSREPRSIDSPRSEVLATLSLFVPGAGQLVGREGTLGFFFLSAIAFLGTFAWALVATIDRLTGTLELLEVPPQLAFWTLCLLYGGAASLHVGGVIHAHRLGSDGLEPHPIGAGVASFLLPGWGQILNGACGRGALLLASLWAIGAGAWLVSPFGHRFLSQVGLSLPPSLVSGVPAAVLLAVPVILWALSIYDAVAWAAARRVR